MNLLKRTLKLLQPGNKKVINELSETMPTSGGNSFYVKQALDNQDILNKATIPKAVKDMLNMFNSTTTYTDYQLIIFTGEYFTNRFQLRCDDKRLQDAIYKSIWAGYLYGKGGIWWIDGTAIPFAVSAMSVDNFGKITALDIIPCTNLFNDNITSYVNIKNVKKRNIITLTKEQIAQTCIYKWNTFGHSAYYRLLPYIQQYSYLLRLLNSHGFLYTAKLVLSLSDYDSLATEMEILLNPDVPYLLELGNSLNDGAAMHNKFKVLDFNTDSDNLIKYIDRWKKEMFELLGREFNPDKKERKLVDEVGAEQSGTSSCEYGYYQQLELYKYELDILTGAFIEIGNFAVDENKLNKEFNSEGTNDL